MHKLRINNQHLVLCQAAIKPAQIKTIQISLLAKIQLEVQINFNVICNSRISKWTCLGLFLLKIINLSLLLLKLLIRYKAQSLICKIVIRKKMLGQWVLNLLIFDFILGNSIILLDFNFIYSKDN